MSKRKYRFGYELIKFDGTLKISVIKASKMSTAKIILKIRYLFCNIISMDRIDIDAVHKRF